MASDPLMQAFLGGEDEAHATVRGWVVSVVRHQSWKFSDPESLTQDILVKLLAILRAGRFRGRSSFRTFVFSVSRHSCIDAFRSERFRAGNEAASAHDHEPADTMDDPEARHLRRERRQLAQYVYQRLSERCRELWRLVYAEGLPARVVGERLQITESNVRVRVHRCLKEAREIVEACST
jgi:RNA polymerase sigma-70 factor (ECF subfamily)